MIATVVGPVGMAYAVGAATGILIVGALLWWQGRRRRRAGSVEALADAARKRGNP